MKLETGITGFHFDISTDIQNKINLLKQEISKKNLFVLVKLEKPKSNTSFYDLLFLDTQTKHNHRILIHLHFPYYCEVTLKSAWMNLTFKKTSPPLQELLDPFFTYLSVDYLTSPIQQSDLHELSEIEIEQIKYWETKTLGNLIFNGYD